MEQWDKLSEEYSKEIICIEKILWPELTRKISGRRGDLLLDAGCGSGRFSRYFHEKGLRVKGIDIAKEQIALAKRINPGPIYLQKDATKYLLKEKARIILANMVLCNLSSKREIKKFFEVCSKNLTSEGKLYMTNVTPKFQKTVDLNWIVHTYPSTNGEEGQKFKVKLKKRDGDYLGPFTNYHWSREFLLRSAEKEGLKFEREEGLGAEDNSEPGNKRPIYTLYKFRKP